MNDMNENKIKVYVKVDANGNIIGVNSSIFLTDTSGWIKIDEGTGDKYALAQGNYFDPPLFDKYGNPQYSYVDGEIVENPPDPAAILGQVKISELDRACQNTIYAGIDVETSIGTKHFNLTEHDQINLSGYRNEITAALAGLPSQVDLTQGVWYKADGEGEHHRYWRVDDFQKIIGEAFAFIAGQLTYTDELKTHVRGLQTADEVNAVYYGMPI